MDFYAHSTDHDDMSNWQPLKEHLENVAFLAESFASVMGQDVAMIARSAGLLHDIGKYTKKFQQRLAGECHQVDHSSRGAKIAKERYEKMGYLIAYAIAGHHCGLANGSGEGCRRGVLEDRLKKENLPELCSDWEKEIRLISKLSLPNFKLDRHRMFQCAFLMRMIFSCLVDADRLDTENFFLKVDNKNTKRGFDNKIIEKLSKKLDSYLLELATKRESKNKNQDILKYRKEILNSVNKKSNERQGLFSLTVPTGGGKTLSSLSFALKHASKHGLERVIYVAPFTSIIEQNAEVFRKVFIEDFGDVVLEHHSSFVANEEEVLSEKYQSLEKLKLVMENWDCPIVATTAVQFFESLFSGRPSMCRKLHNIANSVVVLDEVQTLPLHVLRPCVETLKELSLNYQASIVLCTATQPALLEKDGFKGGFENVIELAPKPKDMFKNFERVTVKHVGRLEDDKLLGEIKGKNQVLCIVNSRSYARQLFKGLKQLEEKGVYHLTTAMCAKHRSAVLKEIRKCLKEKLPCRLVATSLIEAGVDIDFPLVFRAEAGLDSIAQAAGRCNREGSRSAGESFVKVFSSAAKAPVEIEQYAGKARNIFKKFPNDTIGLEAIREYFTELFWQKDQGNTELDAEGILEDFSESGIKSIPFETVEKKFRMIKDIGQKPVIINYRDEVDVKQFDEYVSSVARRLQPYIVQVPEKAYDALYESGAIRLVAQEKFGEQFALLKNKHLYSDDYGLDWGDPSYIDAESLIV